MLVKRNQSKYSPYLNCALPVSSAFPLLSSSSSSTRDSSETGGITHRALAASRYKPLTSSSPNLQMISSSALNVGPVSITVSPPSRLPNDLLRYTGKEPIDKELHRLTTCLTTVSPANAGTIIVGISLHKFLCNFSFQP